jgi:hypothetical protein
MISMATKLTGKMKVQFPDIILICRLHNLSCHIAIVPLDADTEGYITDDVGSGCF